MLYLGAEHTHPHTHSHNTRTIYAIYISHVERAHKSACEKGSSGCVAGDVLCVCARARFGREDKIGLGDKEFLEPQWNLFHIFSSSSLSSTPVIQLWKTVSLMVLRYKLYEVNFNTPNMPFKPDSLQLHIFIVCRFRTEQQKKTQLINYNPLASYRTHITAYPKSTYGKNKQENPFTCSNRVAHSFLIFPPTHSRAPTLRRAAIRPRHSDATPVGSPHRNNNKTKLMRFDDDKLYAIYSPPHRPPTSQPASPSGSRWRSGLRCG